MVDTNPQDNPTTPDPSSIVDEDVSHTRSRSKSTAERHPDSVLRTPSPGVGRRTLVKGIGGLIAGSLALGGASAGNHDRGEVPVPAVEGPIPGQPQTGAVHDVSDYGYVEEEYFFSGEARPLGPVDPYPIDEREFPSDEPASYKSRLLVYRPEHRRDFNGTAVVEWPNVSTGRDVPVTWINTFDYAMREGYVIVVASAQKVGVDDSFTGQDLATARPDRYGSLHHPGDEYSYDIFGQAIKSLVARPRPTPPGHAAGRASARGRAQSAAESGADPVSGLNVRRTVATGMSQSAQYLRFYVNAIQEDQDLIDGYLPFVTSQTPRDEDDIRDDLVPVMWVMSESEADDAVRREDSGLFNLWEVAGASHINYWLVHWAGAMDRRDFGEDNPPWNPVVAGQYGQRADGVYGICGVNYFPMRYAYSAAMDQLRDWVVQNEEPPRAPRIERGFVDGEVRVVEDEFGNAVGGLRLPVLDVPLANYDVGNCGLVGRTFRLDDGTLAELYPTREDYLAELEDAVATTVSEGFLLRADGQDLLDRADNVDLP